MLWWYALLAFLAVSSWWCLCLWVVGKVSNNRSTTTLLGLTSFVPRSASRMPICWFITASILLPRCRPSRFLIVAPHSWPSTSSACRSLVTCANLTSHVFSVAATALSLSRSQRVATPGAQCLRGFIVSQDQSAGRRAGEQ